MRSGRDNLARRLDAVQQRHADIKNGHGRVQGGGQVDRLAAVIGLADHLEVRLLLQQEPQPAAHDGVVVSQDNANLWHRYAA